MFSFAEKKTKSKNKKKGGGDGPKTEKAPVEADEPFVPPSAADRTPAAAPAPAQSGQAGAANADRKKKRENLKKVRHKK